MALFLSEPSILDHLPPQEQQRILAQKSLEKTYPRGSILFHAEDHADHIWLVKKGRVHLSQYTSAGRILTRCVLTPGEVFCCLSAMDKKPYPADAMAALESVVLRIPMEMFNKWMQDYPAFAEKVICLFCDRLRTAEHRGCQFQEPVPERILSVLWILFKKFGDTIPFTCREVSEMAGTTVETTIRTIANLRKQKLIRTSRAKITIVDVPKLQGLVSL